MGSSLETIKEAIGGLQERDRAALAAWLNLSDMDDWERQMDADFSPGGRAHSVVERVRAQVREGKFESMPASDATDESH